MPQISFVSDLHLFAKRSSAQAHLKEMIRVARESEHFILGGDIFDFRWSVLSSETATADAAIDWLREFQAGAGDCNVHFLLGNHDDHPLLHERLPTLTSEFSTFQWSRFFHRMGNTLFLHGDVADRNMTAACLERQRNQFKHGTRSPFQHRLYDLVVKSQLHRIAPPAVYPRKRVARRILSYMHQIGHGAETGIEHVCFGHTHRPVDSYQLNNVTFHNCGAPIGAGKFRIVRRDVVVSESTPRITERI